SDRPDDARAGRVDAVRSLHGTVDEGTRRFLRHRPYVGHLRPDGGVPAAERHHAAREPAILGRPEGLHYIRTASITNSGDFVGTTRVSVKPAPANSALYSDSFRSFPPGNSIISMSRNLPKSGAGPSATSGSSRITLPFFA